MLLKLSWYQFKLDCYIFSMLIITPMIITKKTKNNNAKKTKQNKNKLKDIQKWVGNPNGTLEKKNESNTKEGSIKRIEKQKVCNNIDK